MKSIKKIKAIRVISKPLVDWKWRKDYEKYLISPDHFYLQTLRGIHEGGRCFIIGNGPSLRAEDLDKLKGEYTFAANRIFNIFDKTDWRPTYYVSTDDKILKEHQNELAKYSLGHMFLSSRFCTIQAPTNVLSRIYDGNCLQLDVDFDRYNKTSIYISEDVSNHYCDGQTVTFAAIQLAIYMGFKEIYLIGVDHNYSRTVDISGKVNVDTAVQDYFDNKRYDNSYPAAVNTAQYAYTIAREYSDAHSIKIFNATRGGKLEVFERVDFDELMGQQRRECDE